MLTWGCADESRICECEESAKVGFGWEGGDGGVLCGGQSLGGGVRMLDVSIGC